MAARIAPAPPQFGVAGGQFSTGTQGLAPWLRQGTQPLQAGGRIGDFLRTGVLPPAPPSSGQPWFQPQMQQIQAQNVATGQAQQVAIQQALAAQAQQAELLRAQDEDPFVERVYMRGRDSGGD